MKISNTRQVKRLLFLNKKCSRRADAIRQLKRGQGEVYRVSYSNGVFVHHLPQIQYYSEVSNVLPNGLLYKTLTGLGCTTLALKNHLPYVVTVPSKMIVIEKRDVKNGILGVTGETGNAEKTRLKVLEHLEFCRKNKLIPKILVTYDSLRKITPLKEQLKGFYLLVDEFHNVVKVADYRGEASNIVLNSLDYFNRDRITLMTATPLKDLPKKVLKKGFNTHVFRVHQKVVYTIEVMECKKEGKKSPTSIFMHNIVELCKEALNSNGKKNYYFYFNSVKDGVNIADYLRNTLGINLNKSVNFVYSQQQKDKHPTIEIASQIKEIKPINFVTSYGFEGVDFNDPNGFSVFCVIGHKAYTQLHKNDFIQCLGRLKAPKGQDLNYKNKALLIYTNTNYLGSSKEFKTVSKSDAIDTKQFIESKAIGRINETQTVVSDWGTDKPYIKDTFYLNKELKREAQNLYTEKGKSYNFKNEEVWACEFDTNTFFKFPIRNPLSGSLILSKKASNFMDLCKLYFEQQSQLQTRDVKESIKKLESVYPLLKELFNAGVTHEICQQLEYKEFAIREHINNTGYYTIKTKITHYLNQSLRADQKYSKGRFKSNEAIQKDVVKCLDFFNISHDNGTVQINEVVYKPNELIKELFLCSDHKIMNKRGLKIIERKHKKTKATK